MLPLEPASRYLTSHCRSLSRARFRAWTTLVGRLSAGTRERTIPGIRRTRFGSLCRVRALVSKAPAQLGWIEALSRLLALKSPRFFPALGSYRATWELQMSLTLPILFGKASRPIL